MKFVASTVVVYFALQGAEILDRALTFPGWVEDAIMAACAMVGAMVASRLGILPKRS